MNVFLAVMKGSRPDQEDSIQKDRKPVHEMIDLSWKQHKPTRRRVLVNLKKGGNE